MTLKDVLYDWVIPCLIVPAIPIISTYAINWLRTHTKIAISEADKKTFDAASQRAIVWAAGESAAGASVADIASKAAGYIKTTIPDVVARAAASPVALQLTMEARVQTPTVVAPSGSTTIPVAAPTPPVGLSTDPYAGSHR